MRFGPWSKRSWKASHQAAATIAASMASCQSLCGEMSCRIRLESRRPSGRRLRRAAGLGERLADRIALAGTANKEVVDVARLVLRDLHELPEPELGVASSRDAPRLVPARE